MTGKVVPLSQGFPARKADQVTTYDVLSTSTIGYRTNPDTLVGRRGLAIYSQMANDEQVKAVLNFKRDAITSRGWQFKFRDGTKLSEEEQALRKRVFTEAVARMRGSFSDALNVIMTGRAYGFSITEKIYGEIEVDGKEWPAINMLLGRDPLGFRFYTDQYGTLEKIEQQTHRAGVVEVDPKRVIHYVHAPEWDHVYGRSDLREAYRSWYIKDQISNIWPMYLERFAGGFLHASLDRDAVLSDEEYDDLTEALGKAKSLGFILTPAGVNLQMHHPAATSGYKEAIEFHDLAIAKALLVPNLLGISQSNGGAYAQSQTQLEAFYWTLNADAARLEACLNEQLFRDLGDQAWDDGEYPEFAFKPASVEHVKWMVQTWRELLNVKAVIATEEDEAFIRKLLEMPPRDESSTQLIDPHAEQVRKEQADAQAAALAAQAQAKPDEDEEPDDGKPTPVGKGASREFVRDTFHSPGGHEHDQKDHAGGGGGGESVARDRASAAIGQVFETSNGFAIKTDRKETGYDQITIGRGMVIRSGDKQGRVTSVDRRAKTARVDWDNRYDEDVPVGRFGKFEYVGQDSENDLTRRSFITFESTTDRDAWIANLGPDDQLCLGAALAFDPNDAEPPSGSPYVELSVALDEPVLELPLHCALTVVRVHANRVEARYAPAR